MSALPGGGITTGFICIPTAIIPVCPGWRCRDYPAYPSREQMIAYLESYAARFEIKPVFDTAVSRLCRDGAQWRADTAQGSIAAPIVVVATGIADAPYRPSWPGSESFAGAVIHSSEYRNPAPYEGKRVLVIGFGNSGGEIALDFANADIDVALAVRGPVQILPHCWAFRFCHGQFFIGVCPRGLSMSATRRCCGLRSAISKSWDCAAQPKARGRWSRKTGACR